MFTNIPTEVVLTFAALLVLAVGYLLAKLAQKGNVLIPEGIATLKSAVGADVWSMGMAMAREAVKAANRARLNELIENEGMQARAYAIETMQGWLDEEGLEEIDVASIAAKVDAAYESLKGTLEKALPELANIEQAKPKEVFYVGTNGVTTTLNA
jgi:hypothetical protein